MANQRNIGIPVDSFLADIRKVPKKLRINELDDAVVDGKLVVGVSARLIIMRSMYKGGEHLSEPTFCIIKSIEHDGYVCTYDETRQQVFGFNVNAKDLPVIKVWEEKT